MKIGLLADIHSNLEAREGALGWLDKQKPDDVVCLGDVGGYGPNPNECCDLVSRTASVTLMGNHDAAVIGAMSTEYYSDAPRMAIQWTRRPLASEPLPRLYHLPYQYPRPPLGSASVHCAPI